jgi:hypothetical protein
MAFKQTISITMTDCCDTIELCDTTCFPNPCDDITCTTGYGSVGNINKWDVKETALSIKFPDGQMVNLLDFNYVPNNQAYGSLVINSGSSGTISLTVSGIGVIGSTNFSVTIQETAVNLAIAVNNNSHITGWRAYVDGVNLSTVRIFSIASGIANNGKTVGAIITGVMTATGSITQGGTADASCLTLTLSEIWSKNAGVVYNNNSGPAFADGIYEFTYITYNAGKVNELGRVSETVLFDCNAVNCLKESLLTNEDCGCDDKYDERILRTRLKIEQARIQFNECLFSCAQESILKAGKMCSDICKDC